MSAADLLAGGGDANVVEPGRAARIRQTVEAAIVSVEGECVAVPDRLLVDSEGQTLREVGQLRMECIQRRS